MLKLIALCTFIMMVTTTHLAIANSESASNYPYCPEKLTSAEMDYLFKNTDDRDPESPSLELEGHPGNFYKNFTTIENLYYSPEYDRGYFTLTEGPKPLYDFYLCQYDYLYYDNKLSYSHYIAVFPTK